jgi:hypothetical protein
MPDKNDKNEEEEDIPIIPLEAKKENDVPAEFLEQQVGVCIRRFFFIFSI